MDNQKKPQHHIVKFESKTTVDGKEAKGQAVLTKSIVIDSVDDLIKDPEKFLSQLSPDARTNSYYTLSKRNAENRKGESFVRQEHIAFDIDGIDTTREEETARAICEVLEVPFESVGVIATGNGIQIVIRIKDHIEDVEFFKKHKAQYDIVCAEITAGLEARGLPGAADNVIFDQARVLRMPGTTNFKPDKGKKQARTLNGIIKALDFKLTTLTGFEETPDNETVLHPPTYPDTQTILAECDFLKWVDNNPETRKEPEWYAAASIYVRLENGRNLFHEMSQKSPKYNRAITDAKFDQALNTTKPRTCKSIETLWDGCSGCKWFKKCKSPINIQGPSFIKTRDTGFRNIVLANGAFVQGQVNYEDLVKYFDQKHKYVVDPESKRLFTYTGTHYKEYNRLRIEMFAEAHIDKCRSREAVEFSSKVSRRNVMEEGWIRDSSNGKMNFLNGVLDVHTLEFQTHTPDIGFRNVLPYTYDPTAKAPRFEQFLDEVTCGNADYKKTLLEYGGYCLSNDPYWDHKALVLLGEGSNGKSVFGSVLKSLAEGAYSSVRVGQFQNDQFISALDGALFNISEESSANAFKETDNFKALASGGDVAAKEVFKPVYRFISKAKLVFLANDMPWNKDDSFGFKRRFIIVKFDATFDGANKDPFLMQKLELERAGIFNMFVNAYKDMKARGRCFVGKASDDALEEYSKETNPIYVWFEDNYELGSIGDIIPTTTMYDNFINYCEASGYKFTPNIKAFAKSLKRAAPGLVSSREIIDGKRQRVWKCVRQITVDITS